MLLTTFDVCYLKSVNHFWSRYPRRRTAAPAEDLGDGFQTSCLGDTEQPDGNFLAFHKEKRSSQQLGMDQYLLIPFLEG